MSKRASICVADFAERAEYYVKSFVFRGWVFGTYFVENVGCSISKVLSKMYDSRGEAGKMKSAGRGAILFTFSAGCAIMYMRKCVSAA